MIALRREIAVRIGNEPRFVLAALAGIRFSADAVHGDGQRFVRFLADRAEGHRAGRKSLHDFGGGLDFVERNGRAVRLELKHAAQHLQVAILLVHDVREFAEGLEFRFAHGVLQLADRRRIQQVAFSPRTRNWYSPPTRSSVSDSCGGCIANSCFISASRASTSMPTPSMREDVPVKYFSTSDWFEPDRLENLRALITLQRGNSHLRERLQKPLVDGLHVALENLVPRVFRREKPRRGGRSSSVSIARYGFTALAP